MFKTLIVLNRIKKIPITIRACFSFSASAKSVCCASSVLNAESKIVVGHLQLVEQTILESLVSFRDWHTRSTSRIKEEL